MKKISTKKKVKKIRVYAGKRYSWCNCGKSDKYPLCDGTHKNFEGIQPVRIWFHEDSEVSFSRENGKLQLKVEKLEKLEK